MGRRFGRIAIVDRGEPAMRLVEAARELAGELGQDLETVALHEEADRAAAFVREADDAVALDPPPEGAGAGAAGRAAIAFLDGGRLERALVLGRAEAAWAGWGPAAGRPELAELCRRLGVVFVGPDPEVVRRLGDRAALRRLARSAGVPLAPPRARAAGGARRLAVEVLADHHGTAWAAGVRHRGVVEESASRLPQGWSASSGRRRHASGRRPAAATPPRSSSCSTRTPPPPCSGSPRACGPATRSPRPPPGWTWSSCSSASPAANASGRRRRPPPATPFSSASPPRTLTRSSAACAARWSAAADAGAAETVSSPGAATGRRRRWLRAGW